MASEDADEKVNRDSGGRGGVNRVHGARNSKDAGHGTDAGIAGDAGAADRPTGSGVASGSEAPGVAGDSAGDGSAEGAAGSGASAGAQPVDPKIAAAVAAAEAAGPGPGETVRIDSWIWAVRLIKTRSLGAAACRGGHVHVNGERVKPAYSVRVGDEVRLRHEGRERIVIVKRLIRKRVGAPVAAQCYIDNSPPPPPREAVAPAGLRDRGTGRPTKRDRREMERLRGLGSLGGLGGPTGPAGFGGSGGPGKPTKPSSPGGPGKRPRGR